MRRILRAAIGTGAVTAAAAASIAAVVPHGMGVVEATVIWWWIGFGFGAFMFVLAET